MNAAATGPASKALPLVGLSLLAGTVAVLGFGLSFASPVTSAVFLGLIALVAALLPSKWDRETPASFALTMASAAGWILVASGEKLDPIVSSGFRCGTGDVALLFLGVPFVFVAASTVFPLLRKILQSLPRAAGLLGRWGLGLLWLAGVAMVIAGARHRVAHAAPESFLESLPIVAEVPSPGSLPCKITKGPAGHDQCLPVSVEAGPLQVSVQCGATDRYDCLVEVKPDYGDPLTGSDAYFARDEPIHIRRDEHLKLYFVESRGVSRRAVSDDGKLVFYVSPGDVADELGAPTSWLELAAGGLALALVAAALGFWRERRAQAFDDARSGQLLSTGWIELAAGAPPAFVGATSAVGPVAVLRVPLPAGYRSAETGKGVRFEMGAPSELASSWRRGATSARLAGVAILLLTLAPLVAALRLGILV